MHEMQNMKQENEQSWFWSSDNTDCWLLYWKPKSLIPKLKAAQMIISFNFFIGKAITVLETGLVLNTHGKVLSGETAGNTHGSLVKGLCSCELGELASSWASISKSLKIETASSQLSPGQKRLSPSHEGKLLPQHHCRGMAKTLHLNHTSKDSPPYCWLLYWKQNFLFRVNYSEHKMHQI